MIVRCILCDIDGTIADNRHRQHLLKTKPAQWKPFLAAAVNDKPYQHIIELLAALHECYPILLTTGRNEDDRIMTEKWLEQFDVPYDRMLMRAVGDYRQDTIIKKEMLDAVRKAEYDPWLSIDDRPDVIKMWRANGVPCLACDDASWWYPKPPGRSQAKTTDNVDWLVEMGEQSQDDRFGKAADELRQLRAKLQLLEGGLIR